MATTLSPPPRADLLEETDPCRIDDFVAAPAPFPAARCASRSGSLASLGGARDPRAIGRGAGSPGPGLPRGARPRTASYLEFEPSVEARPAPPAPPAPLFRLASLPPQLL